MVISNHSPISVHVGDFLSTDVFLILLSASQDPSPDWPREEEILLAAEEEEGGDSG